MWVLNGFKKKIDKSIVRNQIHLARYSRIMSRTAPTCFEFVESCLGNYKEFLNTRHSEQKSVCLSPRLWLWPFLRLLLHPFSFVRFSTLPVEICFYIYLPVCCHYKVSNQIEAHDWSKSTWANMILSKYDLIYLFLLVLIIKWARQ